MSKSFSPTHVIYDPSDPLGPVWALLSLSPPFCIAFLTLHAIVTRDLRYYFVLSGLCTTSALCSVLKRIVRQPRPSNLHSGYGMPSNHAAFVSFCATLSVWFALTQYGKPPPYKKRDELRQDKVVRWIKRWLPPIGSISIAVGCSYSRISLQYHTPIQVMVGALIGSSMGLVYNPFYAGFYQKRIVPWIEESWLERHWDVRSYHDNFRESGNDLAWFKSQSLDEFRRSKSARFETEAKKKT